MGATAPYLNEQVIFDHLNLKPRKEIPYESDQKQH